MKSTTIITALFTSIALALPTTENLVQERQAPYIPCAGLYGNSQCCATDVLQLADLDCASPPLVPTSGDDFTAICSDIGQRARCCAIPILGQALLCQTPIGV